MSVNKNYILIGLRLSASLIFLLFYILKVVIQLSSIKSNSHKFWNQMQNWRSFDNFCKTEGYFNQVPSIKKFTKISLTCLIQVCSKTVSSVMPPSLSPSSSRTLKLLHPLPLSPSSSRTLKLLHPLPLSPSSSRFLKLYLSLPPVPPSLSLRTWCRARWISSLLPISQHYEGFWS